MASGDDMVEGSISSLLVDSLKFNNQNGDDLSPEDITWADSCLVKDPDISDGDWSSMKDALIEILGLQHDSVASHDSSAPMTDGFFGGTDIEMLQSAKPVIFGATDIELLQSAKPGIAMFFGRTNDETVSVQINNEELETVNDEFPLKEAEYYCRDLSETSLKNAFLPNYKEDIQEVRESMSSENGSISSSTFEIEPWTQEIFKVWDLGIQAEEDELFKQLNKALAESSDQLVTPSITDDSMAYKDLKEQSLDDLITDLADLSLNRQF
ncbi:uncharacterized protein [Euphorbia lathyris]|uniref:uncharacterized protein n=1 Tax=Euphorbia lathyris TaxID=212925 RepID=UPI0033135A53